MYTSGEKRAQRITIGSNRICPLNITEAKQRRRGKKLKEEKNKHVTIEICIYLNDKR